MLWDVWLISYTSDPSRTNSMEVRSLTSVLNGLNDFGLDDFNALKLIYLEQFLGSMENSKIRPWSWTLRVNKRQSRLDDLQNFDVYLERQELIVWLTRLDEVFRISTSILNIKVDKPGSTRFWSWTSRTIKQKWMGSTVFNVLSSVLNIEDGGPGSTHLTCLVLVVVSSGHQ